MSNHRTCHISKSACYEEWLVGRRPSICLFDIDYYTTGLPDYCLLALIDNRAQHQTIK